MQHGGLVGEALRSRGLWSSPCGAAARASFPGSRHSNGAQASLRGSIAYYAGFSRTLPMRLEWGPDLRACLGSSTSEAFPCTTSLRLSSPAVRVRWRRHLCIVPRSEAKFSRTGKTSPARSKDDEGCGLSSSAAIGPTRSCDDGACAPQLRVVVFRTGLFPCGYDLLPAGPGLQGHPGQEKCVAVSRW